MFWFHTNGIWNVFGFDCHFVIYLYLVAAPFFVYVTSVAGLQIAVVHSTFDATALQFTTHILRVFLRQAIDDTYNSTYNNNNYNGNSLIVTSDCKHTYNSYIMETRSYTCQVSHLFRDSPYFLVPLPNSFSISWLEKNLPQNTWPQYFKLRSEHWQEVCTIIILSWCSVKREMMHCSAN